MPNARVDPFPRYNFLVEIKGIVRAGFMTVSGLEEESEVREYREDGTGRTRLYVLSRRLAPHFNLDPTSFAGYLFITSDRALEAMENPDSLLRRVKSKGAEDALEESGQTTLF